MKFVLGTTACLMALNVMGQATPDTICTMNCAHPGYRSFSETYPTTGGLGETITREYILHVPSGYDAAVPHPLVIVYHGFGDCGGVLGRPIRRLGIGYDEAFFVGQNVETDIVSHGIGPIRRAIPKSMIDDDQGMRHRGIVT